MNDEATSNADRDDDTTDFGYTRVDREAKAGMVRGVFDSVASRYDLMNDLMSGGVHRLWKRFTIELSAARPGQTILDIAGGTGDLAARFSRLVGPEGKVILADINAAMLEVGRDRLIDKGATGNIEVVQADAQALPFKDNSVDCITIAFGLRITAVSKRRFFTSGSLMIDWLHRHIRRNLYANSGNTDSAQSYTLLMSTGSEQQPTNPKVFALIQC